MDLPRGPSEPSALQLIRWITRPIELMRRSEERFGSVFTVRVPTLPPLVMISDPDAIKEIFTGDPHVLYLSTHQAPFYPGTGHVEETGEGEGKGYTVNVPLLAGGGDAVYAGAFERIVLPIVEAYAPELVLVSAGFDGSARDPLAQMELSSDAFGWMAQELAKLAAKSARGRMALVLEGGYDLEAISRSAAACLRTLLGDAGPESPFAEPGRLGRAVLDAVKSVQREFWAGL